MPYDSDGFRPGYVLQALFLCSLLPENDLVTVLLKDGHCGHSAQGELNAGQQLVCGNISRSGCLPTKNDLPAPSDNFGD